MDEGSCSHPTGGGLVVSVLPGPWAGVTDEGGQSLLGVRAGPPFSSHCLPHLERAVT